MFAQNDEENRQANSKSGKRKINYNHIKHQSHEQ